DINPIQNPYIIIDDNASSCDVFPREAVRFLNRNNQRVGMVEPIVKIFAKYGFSQWGGDWNSLIDYHHFQIPRDKIKELLGKM
ncbi:M15 family metallopeptidase, partial [Rickettsiaceae bacterium]|nr:M15 family metallopeptidase [Rickettsiaceae bacterium]